jgi:hypothetical protein
MLILIVLVTIALLILKIIVVTILILSYRGDLRVVVGRGGNLPHGDGEGVARVRK